MMETFPPPPTLTRVRLRSPQDARRVVRAVIQGKLKEYPCRLGRSPGARTAEPGDVYAYRLTGTGSVVRWTDSLGPWGSSRTRKGFLCYDSQSRRHICRKKLKVAIPLDSGQEEEWQVVAYDYNNKAPQPSVSELRTVDDIPSLELDVADVDHTSDRFQSVDVDSDTVATTSPAHRDYDAFAMIAAAASSIEQSSVALPTLPPFSSLEPLAGPVRTETSRARHNTLPFPSPLMLRSNLHPRLNGTSPFIPFHSPSSASFRERRAVGPQKRGRSFSSPAILTTAKSAGPSHVVAAPVSSPLPDHALELPVLLDSIPASRSSFDCEVIARFK